MTAYQVPLDSPDCTCGRKAVVMVRNGRNEDVRPCCKRCGTELVDHLNEREAGR